MRTSLDSGSLSPHLPAVYRFAFLMTGDAAPAAAVLRHTVECAARGGIADLRDAGRVKRWLFSEARRQCGAAHALPVPDGPEAAGTPPTPGIDGPAAPAAPVTDEARQLAARFANLPEAERAALALFYLYLFDPTELAEVLEIPAAELAPLLNHGRKLLGLSGLDAPLPA